MESEEEEEEEESEYETDTDESDAGPLTIQKPVFIPKVQQKGGAWVRSEV